MPGRHSFSLLDAACLVAVVVTAAVVLKPYATREATAGPAPAATRAAPEVLAAATHLSLTGDVLWWTTGAAVYRTTLSAGRGSGTLVQRAPAGRSYGDIAAPYVVVNDLAAHRSQIMRLGESGPVAETGWIGEHDLVSDGAAAYWTDGAAVRGTRLDPVAGSVVAAGGGRVYYAAGRTIHSVPATGGPARTEATTRTAVAALAVHGAALYWAETDASIHGTPSTEYRVAVAGQHVTALAYDGHRLLWSSCDRRCHLSRRTGDAISTVEVGADPHDVAGDGVTTVLVAGGRLLRRLAPAVPGHLPGRPSTR